jgi:apolipoprotein N-acyltransferase
MCPPLAGFLAIPISGALLAIALPPISFPPAAFLAFVPVFAWARGRGLLSAFLGMGACLGVTFCLLAFAVPDRAGAASEGDAAWLGLGILIFGIVATCLAVGLSEGRGITWRSAWKLAAVAVLLEAGALTVLPPHFALTQARVPVLVASASVAGIWGVSYLLWFCNVLPTLVGPRDRLRTIAGVAGLAWLAYATAWWPDGDDVGTQMRVAAVQTAEVDAQPLRAANADALRRGARLAVWPEFSGIALAPGGDADELVQIGSDSAQAPFVTTFTDDSKPLPYNVAALFGRDGESARYQKRKPFGGERTMHAAGVRAASVPLSGVLVGLNICYDSCFPTVLRETVVEQGAQIVALPTIDPPSPHAFISAMHAAFTPFRAAELGVPIVRADGLAHSMIVDRLGRIVAEAPAGRDTILVGDVTVTPRWTVYRRTGDWFPWAVGLLLVGSTGKSFVQSRRTRRA